MLPDIAPFDPQRILEALARHEVRCVVIGGYAAVLAGVDVVTRGIDITPATDQANLQRLAAALEELHAAIRVRTGEPPVPLPFDPRLLARAEILNLTTDAGDLDITNRPDGTGGYEDLKREAHRQSLGEGLHIAIAIPARHHPQQDRRRACKRPRHATPAPCGARAPAGQVLRRITRSQ